MSKSPNWNHTPSGELRKPVALKVQIDTLGLALEIEIKENAGLYQLLIVQSSGGMVNPDGMAWHAQIEDHSQVNEIAQLLKQCSRYPDRPEWITILDGILVTFRAVVDGESICLKIKDFAVNEDKLMDLLLDRCGVWVPDPAFQNVLRFFGRFGEN